PKQDLPEPACQVDLVLPTDRIPSLKALPKDRKDSDKLTKKDVEKELTVSGIQLDPAADPEGLVYLTVDSVPRAYIFRTTFKRDGQPVKSELSDDSDIRIQAPAFFISIGKLNVVANVDNPPEGATVLLELGKVLDDGSFDVQKAASPVAARDQHLAIS